MRIRLEWERGALTATLADTPTSRALYDALPCTSRANTWGKEVYFEVPVSAKLEPDARPVVDPGTVCFWVQGRSLALTFGPTPVSRGNECRLVTDVNMLGTLDGDPNLLGTVSDGEKITVERAD